MIRAYAPLCIEFIEQFGERLQRAAAAAPTITPAAADWWNTWRG